VQRNPKKFTCKGCAHKHCDSNNPASFKMWKVEGVIESNVCLLPMISSFSHQILTFKKHYQNGFLPWVGGMINQPNKFLQALETIGYASE